MPGVSTSNDGKTAAYLGDVSAPKNLTVSNGQKRKIVLNWSTDSNATHYCIYTAATPFEEFTKLTETTETQYEYTAVAGVTRYFKVSAVDYKNFESTCSKIEKGTTLACPVISDIQSTEENGACSSKVYWYMENVAAYHDLVRYTVNCYLNKELIQTGSVDGSKTSESFYTFEGLAQNVEYEYQVESYLVSAQDEIEASDLLDERTVASMRPNPVDELTATEGEKPEEITLTFKLPEKSYVATQDSVGTLYAEYPLYFKIYRRPVKTDEDEEEASFEEKVEHLYFDGSTTGHGIEITSSMSDEEKVEAEKNIAAYFDGYEAGTEISWTEQVARGVKYEYQIKSYIDNYKRDYTTDSSVATAIGWAYKEPKFTKPKLSYEFNEDRTEKLSATVTYNFTWDNFGNEANYKYIVKTDYDTIGSDKTSSTLFDTIEDLNSAEDSFDLSKYDIGGSGDYFYTLYIVPGTTSETDISSAIETIQTSKIHISATINEPYFPGFEVQDGYKDKAIISWELEAPNLIYNLYRGDALVKTVNPADYTYADGAKYTFTDTGLLAGETYTYSLTGQHSGITEVFTCNDDLTAETLGVPTVVFDMENLSYNSITLLWSQVQKAENYKVFFGDSIIADFSYSEYENSDGDVVYTVEKPEGYNDATKSGMTIVAKVEAYNSVDSAESDVKNVCTLGPANTSPTATVVGTSKHITLTWKKIEGANGYAIRRDRCSVTAPETVESTDIYYIDSLNNVAVGMEREPCPEISVSFSSDTYTLVDKYRELIEESPSNWQKNQDMIVWGFPYRYTVFPLKDVEDEMDEETPKIGDRVTYTNVVQVCAVGSCFGYGHNVTASKSEDGYSIFIKWDDPYELPETASPKLFYKLEEYGEWANYKAIPSLSSTTGKYSFKFDPDGKINPRTGVYYFAVGYESIVPNKTYLDYLETKIDPLTKDLEEIYHESLNKGYTYSLVLEAAPVIVDYKPTLSEEIRWTSWDYEKRAIGPDKNDKMELCLFNNDYIVITDPETDDGWRKIAEINNAGTITETLQDSYNIKITEKKENSLKVTPDKLKDESHQWYNGLLKVQRDYKHYVKLVCDRNTDTGVAKLSWADRNYLNGDFTVYGYRNFTDGEIARMAMLILSQGFYMNDTADETYSLYNYEQPKYGEYSVGVGKPNSFSGKTSGSAVFESINSITNFVWNDECGKGKATFKFNDNYNCSVPTPGGATVITPFGITTTHDNPSAGFMSPTTDVFLYHFRTDGGIELKTTLCNSNAAKGYYNDYENYQTIFDASITMIYQSTELKTSGTAAKKKFSLTVTRDGKTTFVCPEIGIINYSDKGILPYVPIMSWCPIQMHPDKYYRFKDAACDWWGETEE